RQFDFLPLARDDVGSAARESQPEAADDVAEDRANERAPAGSHGGCDDVAPDVLLLFDRLAFFHFHVFAWLAVGLYVRLLDGDDAHLHRNQTAIDFDGAKREIHVCLATDDGETPGLLYR